MTASGLQFMVNFLSAARLEESFKPLVFHETIFIMAERMKGMAALLN